MNHELALVALRGRSALVDGRILGAVCRGRSSSLRLDRHFPGPLGTTWIVSTFATACLHRDV
jgi:hypothetical protein